MAVQTLSPAEGSPPSPRYEILIRAANGDQENKRNSLRIPLVDVGEEEPIPRFWGDLDPKTRVVQGEITVIAPVYAMGLTGYYFYPTSNGQVNKIPEGVVCSCVEHADARGRTQSSHT